MIKFVQHTASSLATEEMKDGETERIGKGIQERRGEKRERQSSPKRYSPGRGRNERVVGESHTVEFLEERANESARSARARTS